MGGSALSNVRCGRCFATISLRAATNFRMSSSNDDSVSYAEVA